MAKLTTTQWITRVLLPMALVCATYLVYALSRPAEAPRVVDYCAADGQHVYLLRENGRVVAMQVTQDLVNCLSDYPSRASTGG